MIAEILTKPTASFALYIDVERLSVLCGKRLSARDRVGVIVRLLAERNDTVTLSLARVVTEW